MSVRVCLVSPGLLPVPATQGGAIETLITTLVRQNERYHFLDLTVVSPYEQQAHEESEKYPSTTFLFLRPASFSYKVVHKIWGVIRSIRLRQQFSHISAYYAKVLTKLKKSGSFDAVVVEGGPCDAPIPYTRYFGDALVYHLHYNPTAPFHSKGYSRVVAVSEYVASSWRHYCLDKVTDIRVVHNGIDLSRFQRTISQGERNEVRAELGFKPDDFVVLYCGRIIQVKGVLELLKATQRVVDPGVRLMIVGSPNFAKSSHSPYLDKVQHLVNELGDRVAFTGYVPNDQVYRYSKSADLQAVPSLWEDAAPLVGVEAMAAGLPLLVTRSGGLQEYVPEQCSLVVERDKYIVDSLADAITTLRNNPALCARMADFSLEQVVKFSQEAFYKAFVKAVSE